MANKNTVNLGSITVPLAGTEVIPIWDGSTTVKVTVTDLTAGRAVDALSFKASGNIWGANVWVIGPSGTNYIYIGDFGSDAGTFSIAAISGRNLVFTNAYAGVEDLRIDSVGNLKVSRGNLVQGTAAKGINFTANTPAAGMTSQLLNWYEEGTWTPNQGSGLTVVGAFSSVGTYTRIGRQVTLTGYVTGATSVAVAAGGNITTNAPFAAGSSSAGIACGYVTTSSGTVLISTTLLVIEAIAASTYIMFSTTYSI